MWHGHFELQYLPWRRHSSKKFQGKSGHLIFQWTVFYQKVQFHWTNTLQESKLLDYIFGGKTKIFCLRHDKMFHFDVSMLVVLSYYFYYFYIENINAANRIKLTIMSYSFSSLNKKPIFHNFINFVFSFHNKIWFKFLILHISTFPNSIRMKRQRGRAVFKLFYQFDPAEKLGDYRGSEIWSQNFQQELIPDWTTANLMKPK